MDEPTTQVAATLSGTDSSFGGRWPYAARGFGTADGRLAYYDEGRAEAAPIVLLHGNPSWSYLYRRIIPPLLDADRRVIAVDHLGFGLSDKPDRSEVYGVPEHAARLDALLESLDLCSATLVVHDWSGPIGGRAATRAVRTPGLGSLLVRRRAVLTEGSLLKAGLADPGALDELDREAYRAPHQDAASRTALLAFPRQIPFREGGPVAELSAENADGLARHFARKPVALLWGMRDVLFGPAVLRLWRELLPHADVTAIDRAGHFVQEDAPDEVTAALLGLSEGASGRAPPSQGRLTDDGNM